MKLLNLLFRYAKLQMRGSVSDAVAPVGPYVQKMGVGIACLAGGVCIALLMLTFLSVSLFFALIQHGDWSIAGLWTSLALAFIAGVLLFIGQATLKKPVDD